MQASKRGQAHSSGFEFFKRQRKRHQRETERVERQHPVQANDFSTRQQRKKQQRHHHQTSQKALRV